MSDPRIEQEALLQGATQQQAEAEAKQQTQKQSNELANKKKKAEQPATDPRLQSLRTDLQKTKGVDSVSQPLVNKQGTAAVYTLIPTTAPSDLSNRPAPEATRPEEGVDPHHATQQASNLEALLRCPRRGRRQRTT